jgi:hypothetical protein
LRYDGTVPSLLPSGYHRNRLVFTFVPLLSRISLSQGTPTPPGLLFFLNRSNPRYDFGYNVSSLPNVTSVDPEKKTSGDFMGASSDFPSNVPGSPPANSVSANVSVVPAELDQALLEFDLMLRYVLSEGIALDDETQEAIIGVQQMLQQAPRVSVAASVPSVVVPPEPSFPPSPQGQVVAPPEPSFARLLMTAHAALAKMIAPATPLSLAATEPGPVFGYLSNPPLIRWMIFIALFSVIGFLLTSIVLGNSQP